MIRREIGLRDAGLYLLAQVAGAICGAMLAHGMFEEPIVAASTNARTGFSQWLGEFTATFGLVATILGCLRFRPELVPYGVGLFITAGYWFTSSTSFANPAVTIARSLTDTFSGIMPVHMPAFIIAQLIGAVVATLFFRWLCIPARPGQDRTVSLTKDARNFPFGEVTPCYRSSSMLSHMHCGAAEYFDRLRANRSIREMRS